MATERPYTPKHLPLSFKGEAVGEFFVKDGVEWFQPAGWAVDPVLGSRVVREANVPFAGLVCNDILPPDLDQDEGRDLGWLCTGCRQPLVARVAQVVLLGGENLMEWKTADRWRLVCPAGCKGNNSSGSVRSVWASVARAVARGERQRPQLPAEYRSSFDRYVNSEIRHPYLEG